MELRRAVERMNFGERPRYRTDAREVIGSECQDCHVRSWPGRAICHRCGSPCVEDVVLAGRGTVQTYTVVHVARPGLDVPYVLGLVILDDNVRLYAHLRNMPPDVRLPCPVSVNFAADRHAVPPFWFEPA